LDFGFLLSGYLVAWLLPGSVTSIAQSILNSKDLLSTISIDPFLISLSQSLISTIVVEVSFLLYGISAGVQVVKIILSLAVPIALCPLLASLSFLVACLLIKEPNLSSPISSLFGVLMYASPVFYDPQSIHSWILAFVRLNPSSWVINWERHFLLGGSITRYYFYELIILQVVAWVFYKIAKKSYRRLAEVL
jgi:ABC-type polysaccharide/polyol phosphate export permease